MDAFLAGQLMGAAAATALACFLLWGILRLVHRVGGMIALWIVAIPLGVLLLYAIGTLALNLVRAPVVMIDGTPIPAAMFRTQALLNLASLIALFVVATVTVVRSWRRTAARGPD
ncbi:hypothetical protein [Jannaschia sp. LMIT008]|uniref:hypothetical protein n=1 Tax=Jannaschia maritima TaxID=3032585 RepID=UPI002811158D|nr:hypothetical protein [Jannaschia sp. LMIT008]